MPIREYHCSDCHHEFETIEVASSPAAVCESCGGTELERKLSVFASHAGSAAEPMPPCGPCGCAPSQACSWEQS